MIGVRNFRKLSKSVLAERWSMPSTRPAVSDKDNGAQKISTSFRSDYQSCGTFESAVSAQVSSSLSTGTLLSGLFFNKMSKRRSGQSGFPSSLLVGTALRLSTAWILNAVLDRRTAVEEPTPLLRLWEVEQTITPCTPIVTRSTLPRGPIAEFRDTTYQHCRLPMFRRQHLRQRKTESQQTLVARG